ncbi:MAG: putative two-component system sensor kinase [Chloroflexi bacterium]|nr:putative two-component system sensor kinase [Chloroflexota bacterium]
MSGPRSVRRHRVLIALPLVATAVAIVATVSAAAGDQPSGLDWGAIGGVIAFTTVGALIEDRRPGQAVGRICLTMGLLLAAAGLLFGAAVALDSQPGHLPPLGAALAVIGSAMSSVVIALSGPLLISRFPEGREPGRLAILTDALLAVSLAVILTGALQPGPLEFGSIEPVDNPLAVAGIPFVDAALTVALFAYGLASILALVGLVRRYVRGSSVVRAQIRWLAAAIGISIVLFALLLLTSGDEALNGAVWTAWVLSLLLPPLAIGVAIIRYRLYEIDRIVSRTISYGVISATLLAVYAGLILILQGPLGAITGGDTVAVAASTLIAAALFQPVRRRTQAAVDHRFNRARYDSERTLEALAARLRDEMDLPIVSSAVVDAVVRSVEPTAASLWLRFGRAR